MSDPSCAKLRFYNARRDANDTKGTGIAIAVKSTGAEIYNGTTLKYRMYERINSASTIVTQLTRAEAVTRIGYVKSANEKSYGVDFTKNQVQAMLGSAGCNGIRLVPERLATGMYTMRMQPANINNGSFTQLPAPPSVLCTEPCPTFCGAPPSTYINQ